MLQSWKAPAGSNAALRRWYADRQAVETAREDTAAAVRAACAEARAKRLGKCAS